MNSSSAQRSKAPESRKATWQFDIRAMFAVVTAIAACTVLLAANPIIGGEATLAAICASTFVIAMRSNTWNATFTLRALRGAAVVVNIPASFFFTVLGMLGLSGSLADTFYRGNIESGLIYTGIAFVAAINIYLLLAASHQLALSTFRVVAVVSNTLLMFYVVAQTFEIVTSTAPTWAVTSCAIWMFAIPSVSGTVLTLDIIDNRRTISEVP